MNNQKIIVCFHCHYFPSKIDQTIYKQINISKEKLYWKCNVCAFQNIYKYQPNINLQQSPYIKAKAQNILDRSTDKDAYDDQKFILIVIDCNDIHLENDCYLVIKNHELLSQQLHNSLKFMKNQEDLARQSDWFTYFYQRLEAFNKFSRIKMTKNNNKVSKKIYLIYLLHQYILKINNQTSNHQIKKINIIIQYQSLKLGFQINKISLNQNKQVQEFLEIYALIIKDKNLQWIDNAYRQILLIKDYQFLKLQKMNRILLIGAKYQDQNYLKCHLNIEFNTNTNYEQIFFLRLKTQQDSKYFSIYPFHRNFILKKISPGQNDQDKEQFITFFYHSSCNDNIQYLSLKNHEITELKQYFLFNEIKNEKTLIEYVKKTVKQSQIKMLKCYGQVMRDNEKQFIFYIFDWNNLERQQIQYFDDRQQQTHYILPEDVLQQTFLRYEVSNPFAKKTYRGVAYRQEEINEEDYEVL